MPPTVLMLWSGEGGNAFPFVSLRERISESFQESIRLQLLDSPSGWHWPKIHCLALLLGRVLVALSHNFHGISTLWKHQK